MKSWKSIVVGVRFQGPQGELGPGSAAALRRGLDLARALDGTLTCLTSVAPNVEDEDDVLREIGNGQREGLARIASEAGAATPTLVVADALPHEALAAMGESGQADLVVVARHEEPGTSRRLMGTTASRVVRACRVPAWIEHTEERPRTGSVLAATDLTPVGDLACTAGAALARHLECDLDVVHAWQRSFELAFEAKTLSEEELKEKVLAIDERAREHVRGVEGLADLGDRLHVRVGQGAPSAAILNHAEQLDARVCVLGAVSRVGLPGMLIGSTAQKLLDRLPCSMLSVHGA